LRLASYHTFFMFLPPVYKPAFSIPPDMKMRKSNSEQPCEQKI
jgi:hypothetical protein